MAELRPSRRRSWRADRLSAAEPTSLSDVRMAPKSPPPRPARPPAPPVPAGKGGMAAIGSGDDSQEGGPPPAAAPPGDRISWGPISDNVPELIPPSPGLAP
eukprot:9005440-Pyramimonas_sp.AAC.1